MYNHQHLHVPMFYPTRYTLVGQALLETIVLEGRHLKHVPGSTSLSQAIEGTDKLNCLATNLPALWRHANINIMNYFTLQESLCYVKCDKISYPSSLAIAILVFRFDNTGVGEKLSPKSFP